MSLAPWTVALRESMAVRNADPAMTKAQNHPLRRHRLRADGPRVRQRRGALVPPAEHGRAARDRGRLRHQRRRCSRGSRDNFPRIRQVTADYRELLANPEVDAVYCAVPHHLHEQIYVRHHRGRQAPDGREAVRHRPGRQRGRSWPCSRAHPEVFVRCSSEFPFFPGACSGSCEYDREGRFGRIIEVEAGFLHSSDLDPKKPINWKRHDRSSTASTAAWATWACTCCTCPFRAGWMPRNVRACSRRSSPSGRTARAAWRRARRGTTPSWSARCRPRDQHFPMTLRTKRIAPGETNTWFIEILGTEFSAEFSTEEPEDAAHCWPTGRASRRAGRRSTSATSRLSRPSPAASSSSASPTHPADVGGVLRRAGARRETGCASRLRVPRPRRRHAHHRVLTAAVGDPGRTGQTVQL